MQDEQIVGFLLAALLVALVAVALVNEILRRVG